MAAVSGQMPEKRWKHTLGVMESAVKLAEQYGADPVKADLAAILHDVCKYWPVDRQASAIRRSGRDLEVLEYDKPLWHAHAGAYVAERDYGVQDEEVLDAIRWHTSGREKMTLLDKIVCLADYIEPGRDFPGVDRLRALAERSLEEALLAGFDGTIQVLIGQRKTIYPLTVMTRNALIKEIETNKR
jgi:predicted HD superfamily hydrolase involved in NAD metabolism